MTEKLSDYLKTADAAEFLGVSQNTLRTWAKQGKIPVRVNPANGYRLFRQSELAHLLERTHNDRFIAIMDRCLSKWRSVRDLLNSAPLAHESWSY